MEIKNLQKNCKKYLKFGKNTQPFLSSSYVKEKVEHDYNIKIKTNPNYTTLQSLMAWIKHNVHNGDEKFNQQYKFKRTSKEIWESGLATGCSDYAMLFCTFARQLGYSTTFLQTVSEQTLNQIKDNQKINIFKGHSFCECYFEGQWVLCDPTNKTIIFNYNLPTLKLNYQIGNSCSFIAYSRDVEKKLYKSIGTHNNVAIKKIQNMLDNNTKILGK